MTIDISPDSENSFCIRVLDQHYQDIPEDLYIPPEAFAVLLMQFEGPLDFLLYLVQKNGFDLKNIDIAPIAKQYLDYMETMKSFDIELTADYMVMAALLADLKSRLLLPKVSTPFVIEDDPRKQLIDRLEHYLRVKQAAERLGQLSILERDVFEAKVSLGECGIVYEGYDATNLHDAMMCIFHRPQPHIHAVMHEAVQLDERIAFICKKLGSGDVLSFTDLLRPDQGRIGIVVTFMAILELVKQQQVHIVHDGSENLLRIQGKAYVSTAFS